MLSTYGHGPGPSQMGSGPPRTYLDPHDLSAQLAAPEGSGAATCHADAGAGTSLPLEAPSPTSCDDTVGTCDAVQDVLGTAPATILPTPHTSFVLSLPRSPRTAWARPSEAAPALTGTRPWLVGPSKRRHATPGGRYPPQRRPRRPLEPLGRRHDLRPRPRLRDTRRLRTPPEQLAKTRAHGGPDRHVEVPDPSAGVQVRGHRC